MPRRYVRTLCELCLFIYVAFAFVKSGRTLQSNFDDKSDAIIWAVKRYHFFFSPSAGHYFITHKVSTYFSPPIKNSNESVQMQLLFGGIWQGEIWTMFCDYHAHRLYYTDHRNNFIGVYDLKTNEHKKVFQGLAWGIDNIGVDWISGNVYWTDTNYNWIMMANRNFSHYVNILPTNSQIPAKIAVHPLSGFLYWSERLTNGSSILRSDLQGRNITVLHNLTYVKVITSLSIDYANDRLYWTERLKTGAKSSAIRYCDLKSADHPIYLVYNSSMAYFEGVAFYRDQLYVTDDLNKKILVIDSKTRELISEKQLEKYMFPRAITSYSDPQHFVNSTLQDVCADSNCQHLCIADRNSDKYSCHCSAGFQLQTDGRSCASSIVDDNFALVVDKKHSKLYQLDMLSPTSPQEVPATSIKTPTAVDHDWTTQTVYWADQSTNSISTFSLKDNTERVIIKNTHVDSLALDVLSGNMYFVNSESAALFVANMNGKYMHTLHIDHIYKVVGMSLDAVRGYIYWSDWGQSEFLNGASVTGVIRSSRLDGSEVKTVVKSTSTPTGLAIDPKVNRLFWTQKTGYAINWYNFEDGTTGAYKLPLFNKNQHPTDLAFWRDYLYITDKYSKQILKVSVENVTTTRNGSKEQVEHFGPMFFFEAQSIHIHSLSAVRTGSDVCKNSNCPHLCLPQHEEKGVKAKCVCQDHFTYIPENNTCVQHASTNDTRPPTFNNTCPNSFTVIIADCLDHAPVQFKIPTAVDDSGAPITVKAMVKVPVLPVSLFEGTYTFHFVATDKSHNKAECRFSINVVARRCFPMWILNPPKYADVGKRLCGNRVGSTANVTCHGSSEVAYQYQCLPNGKWVASGAVVCPPPKGPATPKATTTISSTTTTTTTATTGTTAKQPLDRGKQAASSSNSGMIVGIVIAVLVVLVAGTVFLFLYKRRSGQFIPGITNWKRSEDRVFLTDGDNYKGVL